jgi:hypothetical protein
LPMPHIPTFFYLFIDFVTWQVFEPWENHFHNSNYLLNFIHFKSIQEYYYIYIYIISSWINFRNEWNKMIN